MYNFTLDKQPELLVPIPGEGKPINFLFLLYDQNFFKRLVNETNIYAEI